jgi:hypothetical protein
MDEPRRGSGDQRQDDAMAFVVTTSGPDTSEGRFEHHDADAVDVEDGHLVLRSRRAVVGIYAPGKWNSVTEVRAGQGTTGRRAALVSDVPA